MAVDSKFFNIPFATSGDKATIPEATQPSGSISWTQGFGPDYERDPATDPLAKRVPRDETNEYLYQLSNALKYLQLYGAPQYTSVVDGGPANYPVSARVRYDAGAGMQVWRSLVAANTAVPGSDATKWNLEESFHEATLAEALAAASAVVSITPRRLGASVQRNAWNYVAAGGTANALTGAFTPAITANNAGTRVVVQIVTTNTGAATFKADGAAALPIQTKKGAAIVAGDLVAGAYVALVNIGTAWQLEQLAYSEISKPLPPNSVFYVRTDGNDNNNGSANNAANAFATIQGAINYVQNNFSVAGSSYTIQLGNAGTYAKPTGSIAGTSITLKGDDAAASTYIIAGSSGSVISISGGGYLNISGVTVQQSQAGGHYIDCIGGNVDVGVVRFANGAAIVGGINLRAAYGGAIRLLGGVTFAANGNAAFAAIGGGSINANIGTTYTWSGNPSYSIATAIASETGNIILNSTTLTGLATGQRYNVQTNGVITTGAGGANFIPGTTAGAVANGGVYT